MGDGFGEKMTKYDMKKNGLKLLFYGRHTFWMALQPILYAIFKTKIKSSYI